jgi:hypothetical protein
VNGDRDTVKRIRDALWRQGSIVSSESTRQLTSVLIGPALGSVSDSNWWIVVSHDCDILNSDLGKEPWVEVIRAIPVGRGCSDPCLRNGHNPRRIQLEGTIEDRSRDLEVSIHDRWRRPRRELARMAPDSRRALARGTLRILAQWIAKRYVRSGFPDAFNDRLKKVTTRFRRFVESHDRHLRAIFVALDPDVELPEGEDYRCAMVLVYPVEWNDPDAREAMEGEFRSVFEDCRGINLVEVRARSASEFTLADLNEFRRMDFDFLSYADDDPVLPPEGVDRE